MESARPSRDPLAPAATLAREVLVQAEGLGRWFGSLRAVAGVSFEVRRGEVVGCLGPNGAGKSTTMRMLTGSLVPDEGRVRIGGEDVHGPRGRAARARLGYLPETTPLYADMRVDRYLAFVAGLRDLRGAERREAIERVVSACDLAGMTARRIHTLSKGYRQRVGLAQALVADPDVLVLDEPTSGLDPAEIVRIRDLVLRLARSKTILVSSHVLSEVEEVCQRVLILAAGRLVADGTLGELVGEEPARLVVELAGPPTSEAREVLATVAGVRGVEPALAERGPGASVRLVLAVDDRCEVAARLADETVRRGWRLLELRPEAATLEALFLRRTRGLERAEGEQAR